MQCRTPAREGETKVKLSPPASAVAAAVLFGVSTPILKILVGEVPPLFLVAFLYLGTTFGISLLGVFLRSLGPGSPGDQGIDRHDAPWLILAITAGGVTAPFLLVQSLGITRQQRHRLLLNFEAVATTILAVALFREKVGRRVWSALAVITGASILLTWNPGLGAGLSIGAAGVVFAWIFWGIDNNPTRKIAGKYPFAIVSVKSFSSGAIALALAFSLGETFPRILVVLTAMVVGVICYGMSMVFFIHALRDLGAARTGAYFSTAPSSAQRSPSSSSTKSRTCRSSLPSGSCFSGYSFLQRRSIPISITTWQWSMSIPTTIPMNSMRMITGSRLTMIIPTYTGMTPWTMSTPNPGTSTIVRKDDRRYVTSG